MKAKSQVCYLVEGVRTPFCRAGGMLSKMDAVELGRNAVSSLIGKMGLDPEVIDETILGCVGQPIHAQNVARVVALRSGIPESKPAFTVHRNCASGLEALLTARDRIASGRGDVFVVGGVESMSQMPYLYSRNAVEKFTRLMKAKGFYQKISSLTSFRISDFKPVLALQLGLTDPVATLNMGQTAEILAREFEIDRELQDAFAMRSHLVASQTKTSRADEIRPVYDRGEGIDKSKAVLEDDGVRENISAQRLAELKPLFSRSPGASVTAGNASQITDGGVALLVCSEAGLMKHGWTPLARLVEDAVIGCQPERMGLGPVKAIDLALQRARWDLNEVDLFEINEAFAAQVLAVLKCLREKKFAALAGLDRPLGEIPDEKLNQRGGSIALGHPVGATGARLILTACQQMREKNKSKALISLCVGGGQGIAACLSRT